MTPEQEKALDRVMAEEVTIDLTQFEAQPHEWLQRGRELGCRCHPGRAKFLALGVNLVGIKDGKPVLKKD